MQPLPTECVPYKKTPVFTEETIPAGLLKAHQTKHGTWGKIVILEGRLRYKILEPIVEEVVLDCEIFGVVEPEVLHEVATIGAVRFYVEFLRC